MTRKLAPSNDTSFYITAAGFAAYLRCPTESYLTLQGEKRPDSFFDEIRARIAVAYKARANQSVRAKLRGAELIEFAQLSQEPANDIATRFVDCECTVLACNQRMSAGLHPKGNRRLRPECVSTLYSAWDRSDAPDNLLVCFGALAIVQTTGGKFAVTGKVIRGEGYRIKAVRFADHLAKTLEIIKAIDSLCKASDPPAPVLNKHCPSCAFQSRCRSIAMNRDDLSLVGAMTVKERAKYQEKGISTITQLSYGYRPRRRRRMNTTALPARPSAKHDHKLKALAIKKGCVHVVGSPSLAIEGTPVFIDVEGIPDRDFYYLIGLRYETGGPPVEHSFWADGPEGEYELWDECLRALQKVENPKVVHYGAYEARFLKLMRKRWRLPDFDAEFVDRIVDGSINLLAVSYGRIYFPTYSNGLKEIARWLGFQWTWPQASGSAAVLVRRCWELTSDDELRRKLIEYNIEDCRAAAIVAQAFTQICGNGEANGTRNLEIVDVGSLEVGFQRTFGKFPSALPEFEKINRSAYWDYQRSKVYVRTNKAIRRNAERAVKPFRMRAAEKEVVVDDRPASCPRCGASKVWIAKRSSHIVFDLNFTRRGIRRSAVHYWYNGYRCGACNREMTIHSGRDTKYGHHLRAYVLYLLIEMRLSNQKISEHVATVFNIAVTPTAVHYFKVELAHKYQPTYNRILEQIASGPLVHADETKGVVFGGGHYVWVFANLTSAAYVYSSSREASILEEVLAGFKGVLVSDFYGGYDALDCPQQKCLIHLMRDINDDVLKHPFNEELVFVAQQFGSLLRDVVQTIDQYGLRRRHLRKHKSAAERFLNDMAALQCTTESGTALKKRIIKNRQKLFTFLDYDNVPWNNNNAEHAVRAFTRLRNVMVTSTPKGTREYCVLLTVQQTLRYRGEGFLEFLRSGKTEID